MNATTNPANTTVSPEDIEQFRAKRRRAIVYAFCLDNEPVIEMVAHEFGLSLGAFIEILNEPESQVYFDQIAHTFEMREWIFERRMRQAAQCTIMTKLVTDPILNDLVPIASNVLRTTSSATKSLGRAALRELPAPRPQSQAPITQTPVTQAPAAPASPPPPAQASSMPEHASPMPAPTASQSNLASPTEAAAPLVIPPNPETPSSSAASSPTSTHAAQLLTTEPTKLSAAPIDIQDQPPASNPPSIPSETLNSSATCRKPAAVLITSAAKLLADAAGRPPRQSSQSSTAPQSKTPKESPLPRLEAALTI